MRSASNATTMARPRKQEKREHQLNLKLTSREREWVRRRAASRGMVPAEFGRAQLLAELPQPAASQGAHDPMLIAQLSRIGNNLNQIARGLHQLQMPPPGDLQPLLDAIRDIIREVSRDGA